MFDLVRQTPDCKTREKQSGLVRFLMAFELFSLFMKHCLEYIALQLSLALEKEAR